MAVKQTEELEIPEDFKGCRVDVLKNWTIPNPPNKYVTGLKVNNSLSGGLVPFVPAKGNIVNWYGCGPTVYDAAHMGHARNYVTFDILRRIMETYFGYSVNMCMNITDIDDKIIARAAEQKIPFEQLSRFWENDFFIQMQALGCKLPDVITRVSEYVPKIITFIEDIIRNGYAYESNGSVYFDIAAFRSSKQKHVYGRMEPWSVDDGDRVLEGEGALGAASGGDKRSALDFALWKRAKENEPSWESPWGKGRPGWHIECSTMASDALGFPLDLHSGGIDLRFPHHDNELAQSEAAYDRGQWVNYFLHSGHLHIYGAKMAKSLKNFITISDILESYSPRVIRLLVLLHKWDQPMNYSPDGSSMVEPSKIDKQILNFFASVKQIVRKTTKLDTTTSAPLGVNMNSLEGLNGPQHWNDTDRALFARFQETQSKCHEALCDNFNTPQVMTLIMELISAINVYIAKDDAIKGPLVLKAATYIARIFTVFGLITASDAVTFAYGVTGDDGAGSVDDDRFATLMDILGSFRHDIREKARSLLKKNSTADPKELAKEILTQCDNIRDEKLGAIGIQLEDQGVKGFVWKDMPKEPKSEPKSETTN